MKELTLERNHMYVSNVGKPLLVPVTFKYMKELILDRNPMDVSNLGKLLLIPVTFEALEELTLERNFMELSNAKIVFTCPATLKRHKGTYTIEKSLGYKQFPLTLTNVSSLYRETL
jgi:hypothetical protein